MKRFPVKEILAAKPSYKTMNAIVVEACEMWGKSGDSHVSSPSKQKAVHVFRSVY